MLIEVISDYMHDEKNNLKTGETRAVADGLAKWLITHGYAKDPSGIIPTGEKPTGPVRLKPADVVTVQGG